MKLSGRKVKIIIYTVLVLIWMVFIYSMSAKEADESSKLSMKVGMKVGETFVPGFDSWNEHERFEFAKTVDHPVRKAAHATEYAILGIFLYLLLSCNSTLRLKYRLAIDLFICAVYAASDEIHQLFVKGRDGNIVDVLIDCGGAIVGIMIAIGICTLLRKKNAFHSI